MIESTFKFINYRIKKISINIDDNFGISAEKLDTHFDVSHEVKKDNNRAVIVLLKIGITSKSKLFVMEIHINGFFEAHEDMPEDMFKKMCEINAPAILLPYARSIVTNFTALANIKPIILPLFNLTPVEKKAITD
jgi:preprotein translocase subunit SecB